MLSQLFPDPLSLRVAQAIGAALFALLIGLIASWHGVKIRREIVNALGRGIVQIIVIGFILALIFSGTQWLSGLVLLVMMLAAAYMAAQRAKHIPNILSVTLRALFFGAGIIISVMLTLGIMDTAPSSLVAVSSMLIANAMNTTSLALDRLCAEIETHTGQIEAGLALGVAPNQVIEPYIQATIRTSLIPSLNNLRSLGIVWIPGLMAGMILAGADPLEAAIYQFVVITMQFATAATSVLLCTRFVRPQLFTTAEQLRYHRPTTP